MLDLAERPALFGAMTAAVLAAALRYLPDAALGHGGARAAGLIVFGAAIGWLTYQTRDSGAVFRFFLGGLAGILAAFLIGLKF